MKINTNTPIYKLTHSNNPYLTNAINELLGRLYNERSSWEEISDVAERMYTLLESYGFSLISPMTGEILYCTDPKWSSLDDMEDIDEEVVFSL